MADPIRLVLVVSDLHSGSTVAAMPPEFETIDGCKVVANPVQSWFYDKWQRMNEWAFACVSDDDFAFVCNGDMIEGVHHRSVQIVAPETITHTNIAHHLLNDLNERAAKTFMVKGTECHTGEAEIALGGRLGAEVCPETGKAASDHWRLNFNGVPCSFAHHCQTSSRRWLRSGELGRMLAAEQLEAAACGHEPPRIVGRAHRHTHGLYQDDRNLSFTTGAWQGLTRFGHKVVPGAIPAPSAVILDWRERDEGELPELRQFIATMPARKEIRL